MRVRRMYLVLMCTGAFGCRGDEVGVREITSETREVPSQEVLNALRPSPYLIYDKPVNLAKQTAAPQPPRSSAEQDTSEPGQKKSPNVP